MMERRGSGLFAVLAVCATLGLAVGCSPEDSVARVGIGYSSLTPVHTHLGAVFERTDVLARHGLDAELIRLRRGKDQELACREGKLDIVFTCEVPAFFHLQRCPRMRLTGCPGELGRTALLVPGDSSIWRLADLRGRRIGVEFDQTTHKDLLLWLREQGWTEGKDVELVSVHPDNMLEELQAGRVDALMAWDPWVERFIRAAGLRVVKERLFYSGIFADVDLIRERPQVVNRFFAALAEAFTYIQQHREEVDAWAAEMSGYPVEVVSRVASFNRHLQPGAEVTAEDMRLDPAEIAAYQASLDYLKSVEQVPRGWTLRQWILQPAQPR